MSDLTRHETIVWVSTAREININLSMSKNSGSKIAPGRADSSCVLLSGLSRNVFDFIMSPVDCLTCAKQDRLM